jgi:hypothetical protein
MGKPDDDGRTPERMLLQRASEGVHATDDVPCCTANGLIEMSFAKEERPSRKVSTTLSAKRSTALGCGGTEVPPRQNKDLFGASLTIKAKNTGSLHSAAQKAARLRSR